MITGKNTDCAHYINGDVCSSDKVINELKKIPITSDVKSGSGKDKNIISILKSVTNCKNEACVVDSEIVTRHVDPVLLQENKRRFKPKGPYNTKEWLTNTNIDEFLDQLAIKYPGFLHVPFQMIDFAKTGGPDSLSNVNIVQKIREGIKWFGVVINTDVSSGPGKHWFALFGNFSKKPYRLSYFNSSGQYPMTQISRWLEDTRNKIIKETGVETEVVLHTKPLQQNTYSCGDWSMAYLKFMLDGGTDEEFKRRNFTDAMMAEFRRFAFLND